MFESITKRMTDIFGGLRGKSRLTEDNIRDGLREVRKALLEADVNFRVVKDLVNSVTEKAVGQDVIKAVQPAQQIVKIVYDELVAVMGPGDTSIPFAEDGPTVIMMAGLQGSGKTTTCGKLAMFLRNKRKRKPLLVAADVQRPAAVKQLQVLGAQLHIPVFADVAGHPPEICRNAVRHAIGQGYDTVILDTAGRLHIDEPLMRELEEIARLTKPHQVFLVCDAMTGQDAVNSAEAFNKRLTLDGVILTKMDGDARGGAALSVRHVTGKPVKFIGVGEKSEAFEEFHPDRVASRILGMGDVVSLVEKAQQVITQEEAEKMQAKLLQNELTLEDFLDQLRKVQKLGGMKDMLSLLPGVGAQIENMDIDDKEIKRVEAVILSMTPDERRHPEILSNQRRVRIAKGSGTDIHVVHNFLRQYFEIKKMMAKMAKPQSGFFGKMKSLFSGPKLPPEMAEAAEKMKNGEMPAGLPMPGMGGPKVPGGYAGPRKKLSQKEKKALRKKHKRQR